MKRPSDGSLARPGAFLLTRLAAIVLCLGPALSPAAQDSPATIHLVERSDWSRYVNGTYFGHAYRESRLVLESEAGGADWSGSWFVLEETLRDTRAEARRLDSSGVARTRIGILGAFDEASQAPLPTLRGLLDLSRSSDHRGLPEPLPPRLPEGGLAGLLQIGSSFIAPGLRRLDLRDASYSLPYLAEYRSASKGSYANRPALLVKAKFATRLALPQGALREATGSHNLDIWLDLDSGLPLFVRDLFDETFGFADGGRERRAGSTLVFWKGAYSMGRGSLIASLGTSLAGDPPEKAGAPPDPGPAPLALAREGIELAQGEAGIVLKIFGLQFKADSDELLPGERGRLDLVATALAAAPSDRGFLVEGHAASAGKPQGELELSQRRAKRIVDELAARGLAPTRFIYRGLGSTKPLAPNDSEAGRARNRRVEISILD